MARTPVTCATGAYPAHRPSIEDAKREALPALRHRIVLNFEGDAEGLTTDALVENLVAKVPVQG